MNAKEMFDAIIIGGGQAGPPLAARLSAAGKSVALIERNVFGGTCVNVGCMPTKTLVASAAVAHDIRRAAEFGFEVQGRVSVDMAAVMKRKNEIVTRTRSNLDHWVSSLPGCTVIRAHARFASSHEVSVEDRLLSAPQIFINVGGRTAIPNLAGVEQVPYLTNASILALEELPRHLIIIGGSYVGLEFAQMYRRFGSEVTVIERAPLLISREDEDVSVAIRSILESDGVAVRTDSQCVRLEARGRDAVVHVDCTSGASEIIGSHVLLAVGRQPNTADLDAAAAGINLDAHGYIIVDDQLRTNVPGIWALGDCNGRGAFTHTAYNDFEIVAANILEGGSRRVTDRIPCYGLFIDPPLGRVGLTEWEARAAGGQIRVGTRPMTRVGRAIENGETQGFMKVIVDTQTERIIGAAILGPGGDEAVHGILDTMAADVSYQTLRRSVHIHPTVSELIPTVLGEIADGAKR